MQDTKFDIQSQWVSLFRRMIERDRFPHTLLLEGRDGYGTLATATAIAEYLLCRDDPACLKQIRSHNHPDLTYIFPTAPTKQVKTPMFAHFYTQWNEFLDHHPFGTYTEWMQHIDAENKQGMIRVQDAQEAERIASLFPSVAPNKVVIFWHAEKMNTATANKLLKLLEEPPAHTYFILTTDDARRILPTVYSRTQHFNLPPLPAEVIRQYLTASLGLSETEAGPLAKAARGDMQNALEALREDSQTERYKDYFVRWVRMAYRAKTKPEVINDLVAWAEELAAENKAVQTEFLRFALEVVRQSLWQHHAPELPYLRFDKQDFRLENFAPFVHARNRQAMYEALEKALQELLRNANPKLTFVHLGIHMTRLLHQKP